MILRVGNTHEKTKDGQHRWKMYFRVLKNDCKVKATSEIKAVEVYLHPTFSPSRVTLSGNLLGEFEVGRTGYGTFDVFSRVQMNDGRRFRVTYELSFLYDNNFNDYRIPKLTQRMKKVKVDNAREKISITQQTQKPRIEVPVFQQFQSQMVISPKVFSLQPRKEITSKVVLLIGNLHKDMGNGQHQWQMYVKEEDKTSNIISKVEFFLHPSFKKNHFIVDKAPFVLTSVGWGTFDVPVVVHLKNGKQMRFNHLLQFEKLDFSKKYEVNYVLPKKKDTFTPMLKKNKVIKDINFPFDCLGEVLSFVGDQKVALNVLLTSKSTQYYIEREHPGSCRNILYQLKSKPTTQKYHVSKLNCGNGKMDNKWLSFFPNLKEITLYHCSRVHDVGLNQLPKLEVLKVHQCLGVKGNNLKLPNLKTFSLRLPIRQRQYRKDAEYSKFKTFTKLEVVELDETQKIIGSDSFKNLKDIRVLKLRNASLKDEIFGYLPNIVELHLDNCYELTADGMEKNKWLSLKTLRVNNCSKMKVKKDVEEAIGNSKVALTFAAPIIRLPFNPNVMTEMAYNPNVMTEAMPMHNFNAPTEMAQPVFRPTNLNVVSEMPMDHNLIRPTANLNVATESLMTPNLTRPPPKKKKKKKGLFDFLRKDKGKK